jgi:hypothetical protein
MKELHKNLKYEVSYRKILFISMIIYYFDFDFLLFLIYKRYYFNIFI